MTRISSIADIKRLCETYPVVGFRGLSSVDAEKKYRIGQTLARSWDGYEYHDGSARRALNGTCAIGLCAGWDWDNDNEAAPTIAKAIKLALTYADSDGDVCIIAGGSYNCGDDDGEWIISTEDLGSWQTRGAIYCGRIDVASIFAEIEKDSVAIAA